MQRYRVLSRNEYGSGPCRLLPIRMEDRFPIMRWRNEQIYHLRQNSPITEAQQDQYFSTVVAGLFEQERPGQILFSYLREEICIGYGGLVHINWDNRNAELSFIMDTALEKEEFASHWSTYLSLIEEVAFRDLALHKVFVYAFDLRPHLYKVLEANGYFLDARLREHCFFDEKFLDVVIHAKINGGI